MFRSRYLRVAALFGLLGAGLVLLYFFTLYALGVNPVPEMNRLDLLIILLCMLFAMGYFRDRRNGGVLHFWAGPGGGRAGGAAVGAGVEPGHLRVPED
jgi:apolipoprotein N-acyltransferase